VKLSPVRLSATHRCDALRLVASLKVSGGVRRLWPLGDFKWFNGYCLSLFSSRVVLRGRISAMGLVPMRALLKSAGVWIAAKP
jgi:hypothetical protein